MSKILEIRIKVPNEVPNNKLEELGEYFQSQIPAEFDYNELPEVEDVTFEVK